MPLYEYECKTCGKILEANQRMSDPPLTDCVCGAKGSLRRLLSAGSGLIFKGSGFYITDYKNGNNSPSAASASESSSKPAESTPKTVEKPSSGHCCGASCACK